MNPKAAFIVVGVTALTTGVVTGWVLSGRPAMSAPSAVESAQSPSGRPAAVAGGGLPDLSAVAEAALKVSANIASTSFRPAPDDFISQFFGGGPGGLQPSQSLGSGVLVSAEGYVLTNTHVIGNAGAQQIRVTFDDGQERPGKLIGRDDVSDLAVVQVQAPSVPLLKWGDSSRLRVAEWVMAVGNPYQLSGTVTLGIVSTVNRKAAQVGSEYSDFIQTDAAINPGNSGGALVNGRGELVGINTMIVSSSGGYQGIGFAIPSNTAQDIMRELVRNGSVRWGSIGGGVRWIELDRAMARQNGFGDVQGLLAYRMSAQSLLYRSGVRPGDILVGFNGQRVTSLEELNRLVVRAPIKSRAALEIVREGRPTTINVTVTER